MSSTDTFVKKKQPSPKPKRYAATSKFIYNSERGTFCGRTLYEWLKVILFYILFYIVLSILFTICMCTFFLTIDMYAPKWQCEESLIGANPGLGIRPFVDSYGTPLIWYKQMDKHSTQHYIQSIDDFLQIYKHPELIPGRRENLISCNYDNPPKRGQVCDVNVNDWYPCVDSNSYGYKMSTPCVFLKLNKIYGWIPDYYNNSDALPNDMPQFLKEYIKIVSMRTRNTVWISCSGVTTADEENIGTIEYYPEPGFPEYFYPYTNTDGYLSPLVAVHFNGLRSNSLINIECRAWAKNIIYNKYDNIHPIRLQLFFKT